MFLSAASLADTVDQKSRPFACSFGKFTVNIVAEQGAGKLVRFQGRGILVNSRWLRPNVQVNPETVYLFENGSEIADDAVVSAFCISGTTNKPSAIRFYILAT